MSVVQVAPVNRSEMKLLISLFGLSETGKTLSALKLAQGIEPDPTKRGLLDCEGGRRGAAYMDAIEGGYMYGALTAPFSPERYSEALSDFVDAGVTTLVIDSVSHAWFAAGGILDAVERATETNDMAKWAKPKRRLGKMTQSMLQCGLHLILCSRAKQPMIEEISDTGKKKYVPGPIVPIQEKSLRYDMTIMAHMLGDGLFSLEKVDGGKCPGALRPIFAAGEKMDATMGKRLIDWIGGQDAVTPQQRMLRMDADRYAGLGTDSFREWWKGRSAPERTFLKTDLANFQSIATAADAEKARSTEPGDDGNITEPFGARALPEGIEAPAQAAE